MSELWKTLFDAGLFQLIHRFLVVDNVGGLRQLCDVNKQLSMFKHMVEFKLTREYSLVYYNDAQFQTMLWTKIHHPSRQLHVDLSSNMCVVDLTVLSGICSVDLNRCCDIVNIDALLGVSYVDLSWCRKLIDVRPLRDAKKVNLTHCHLLTCVDALEHVDNVNLSFCKITNVDALKNVKKLNLKCCNHITDVSQLTGVKQLNLYTLFPDVTLDTSMLVHVQISYVSLFNKRRYMGKLFVANT